MNQNGSRIQIPSPTENESQERENLESKQITIKFLSKKSFYSKFKTISIYRKK